ncbi:hypothetical protein ASD46_25320 [Rhizobium sp. Root491]|nr:hypothetical protein ASD46_25320 [Rhizobium sp. Root491]
MPPRKHPHHPRNLAARERELEVRLKVLLGTWMLNQLQKPADGTDAQALRVLLRCELTQMALRDADHALLEDWLKGKIVDETG